MNKDLIAILSLNMHTYVLNYGSVLQSYALQSYLTSKGKTSIIIDYVPFHAMGYYKPYRRLYRYINILHPRIFFQRHLSNIYFLLKYRKFNRFFSKNYTTTAKTHLHQSLLTSKTIEDLEINTFICGSDTVWKFGQMLGFNKVLYLDIPAAKGKRKFSYAPSMGSERFDDDQITEFQRLTSDFTAISLREQSCVDYTQSFLKKPATHVVDPTLLLDEKDYLKIARIPKEKDYVLIYSCEELDLEMVKEARRIANQKGLKIIEITTLRHCGHSYKHKVIYTAGVEDFLGYFKSAALIVCNSFHGMCFSVIFKKNVFLFERNKSDFKMPDLAKTLGMEKNLISCNDKTIENVDLNVDYNLVYEKLNAIREVSHKFLDMV